MKASRAVRGFTLVEIMMVVAITGILSSVAIPELTRATLRARTAERRAIMTAIAQSVSDVTLTQGRIPSTGATPGEMLGDWNPAGAPGKARRPMSLTATGWNMLAIAIDGPTYYSYKFFANNHGGTSTPTLDVWAVGDVDGDGIQSTKRVSYEGFGHSYTLKYEDPLEGQEDADTF